MDELAVKRSVGWPLVVALVAIPLGLWLFLEAQGINVPPMKRWWPTFFLLAAVGAAVDWFAFSRRPAWAGFAVFFLGLGLLLYGFTLGRNSWAHTLDRLPALPLVIGSAMLATWFADRMRDSGLLAVGGGFAALGVAGLATRFEFLRSLLPSIQEVWAIALLLIGGLLLWRVLRGTRVAGGGE